MDRVTDLTALTRRTPCPACGQRRLEFLLRCDLDLGACLYTAHCRACDVSLEIVTAGAEPTRGELKAAVEPCPTCGGTDRTPALHCEISTHACVYTLACTACARA